ncbi:MAG TPA: substrate-binding domain-containing protein [Candidatus Tectomicrobia bacterium]|nr:substrate-binding domain-containing protein [Candidatus Tectomicrobia bacterium]
MRSHESSLENRIRSRRQGTGLSQQELARRCGMTRQAVNAIEGGHYVPSTLVAMRLAKALGCRVEELFRLTEERPRIEAEWLDESPTELEGRTRIQLARVGERLLARPLQGAAAFTAADGMTVPLEDGLRTRPLDGGPVLVDLLVDAQLPERTVVVLGCDPALGLLGAHLTRRYPGFRAVWIHRSSLAALRMLGRGLAHAAGTHLWDPDSGEYNVPYVRRELAGRCLVIVTLSEWQQGLILAHGNPKEICGPADLERPDVTAINREAGSGSRTMLDLWLRDVNIPARRVRGYRREVSSHLEVATAVASGVADVGPGILAVARALGLDFIPLQEERYDLVIPLEFLNTAPVQALLDVAVSTPFQAELRALGGYDSSRTGTVVAELAS